MCEFDSNIKVSIIMNCFNGDRHLKQALDSIYDQSYSDWEIIFWDNQSSDNSASIAKSYDSRLKYFRSKEHTTLGSARNLALRQAKGQYVTFLDVDDIWYPEKLQVQVDFMDSDSDIILTYGSLTEIDENGAILRQLDVRDFCGDMLESLLYQFDASIITAMIKVSALEDYELSFDSNIRASEEYCLFLQLAALGKCASINDCRAFYRVYSNSLTSQSLSRLGIERRYALNLLLLKDESLSGNYTFKEAMSRSYYYDARWFMANDRNWHAFWSIRKITRWTFRYVILMILTFFPSVLWKKMHLIKKSRI